MKKLTTIIIALFLGISVSQAQNTLSATGITSTWPDTAVLNSTASFSVQIQNDSNLPYLDDITVMFAIDTSQQLSFVYVDSFQQVSIVGNGAVLLPITNFPFDPPFVPGNNNVVIWPIAGDPTFNTLDSLHISVFIINSNSVSEYPEWEGYNDLQLYPNPAENVLFITNPLGDKPVEHVSIYGINGRLVSSFNRIRQLNLEHLDAGLYIIEIDLGKDRIKRFKIIKQSGSK